MILSILSPSLGVKSTRLSPMNLSLILLIPPLTNSSLKVSKEIPGDIHPIALEASQDGVFDIISKAGSVQLPFEDLRTTSA